MTSDDVPDEADAPPGDFGHSFVQVSDRFDKSQLGDLHPLMENATELNEKEVLRPLAN